MVHNILVVDDNQPFLNLITKIFDKYKDKYSIHTTINGVTAIEMLKSNHYSVVITDLQMPNMDGYALLEKIKRQFPDIPVIVITAFDKPKTESVVKKTGAFAYFTKPLVMDNLIACIDELARRENEGGRLNNASLEMFIQLIEMEAKTCTIRVLDEKSRKRGILFFNEGELYNARYNNILGKKAAYTIFSWDKVTLSIENACCLKKRDIDDELQAILLDAMRLKDEDGNSEEDFSEEPGHQPIPSPSASAPKLIKPDVNVESNHHALTTEELSKAKLKQVMNIDKDLKSLKIDDAWSGFTAQAAALGFYFDAGLFKGAYFDRDNYENVIVIPVENDKIIEIVAGSKCSPDKVIKALTE
jgi:CheY-like chemotaxis protein